MRSGLKQTANVTFFACQTSMENLPPIIATLRKQGWSICCLSPVKLAGADPVEVEAKIERAATDAIAKRGLDRIQQAPDVEWL